MGDIAGPVACEPAITEESVAAMSDARLRSTWAGSDRGCGDPLAHLLAAELLRRAIGF